ncbi:siphovirus Gp157 family protein [Oceanobacillus oncorhynchi]|uniref:siphovirus Gp157 family protein n=1 Tax=Oceanobacillus oncorhynchi TaxID=545501 RepID=UPI0034D3CF85
MPKLYELSQNYANIYELFENEEVPQEVVIEALQEIEDKIEVKFDNTGKLIKSFEGDVKAFKEEEKRLAERRKSLENKIKNIKAYLLGQMVYLEKDKINGGTYNFTKKKPQDVVEIPDVHKVDKAYVTNPDPVADKKAIKEAIQAGEEVEGARMVKGEPSLMIR